MVYSFIRFLGLTLLAIPGVLATELHGAGSSFVAPIVWKMGANYTLRSNIKIDYQSVGSGEGIKRIEAGIVDFGASDMPLKLEDLNKKDLLQFPMIMGAITPVINVPGIFIAQLKLDGPALAALFMGKIRNWDDPMLRKLNPNLPLPNLAVSVIHREEKSGTTFNFTNYLSKVSADWQSSVGEGLTVNWPVGLGEKGNAGVAARVKATPGSIGYVEYAYAMEQQLDYVLLKNLDGFFVRPNAGSTKAAATGAQWDGEKGFYQILTNAPGETSWPITATTFMLVRKTVKDIEQTRLLFKFLDWSYRTGELPAIYLDYVMLPREVIEQIRASWSSVVDSNGKRVLGKESDNHAILNQVYVGRVARN